MSLKQRRETVHGRIEDDGFTYGKTVATIKNFVKLFIIDQGAIDTISNDEWSRKIHAAMVRKDHQERVARGEKVDEFDLVSDVYLPSDTKTVQNADQFSLKRLDSFHLN